MRYAHSLPVLCSSGSSYIIYLYLTAALCIGSIRKKEVNEMACDEAFYRQYLSGDDAGLEELMLDVFADLFTKKPKIRGSAIVLALAFATFENVCYLIQNGADRFSFIFFRGFGTGAMHVLCGLIVGGGLAYAWRRTWLKIAGTCGLLGAAITLHAIYNLLIAYGGAAQYIAYALPALLMTAGALPVFRLARKT